VEEKGCEVWTYILKDGNFEDFQIFWNVCQIFGEDECDRFRSHKEFEIG
jgi:hypothetical protein